MQVMGFPSKTFLEIKKLLGFSVLVQLLGSVGGFSGLGQWDEFVFQKLVKENNKDDKSTKKGEAFKYTKCSFIRLPEKGINDGSSGLISSNVNNGQCQYKNNVTEGAIIGNNASVGNDASYVDLP
ncbi:hypothetical protein Tco_1396870 [Tanacetum coccineum]